MGHDLLHARHFHAEADFADRDARLMRPSGPLRTVLRAIWKRCRKLLQRAASMSTCYHEAFLTGRP